MYFLIINCDTAFDAGVTESEKTKAKQAEIDEAKKNTDTAKKTGSFKIDENVKGKSLTKAQKRDIGKIRALSEALDGYHFVVTDLGYNGKNGEYDPETNTITVNIRAGKETDLSPFDYALSQAISHESVHSIKVNAPEYYAKLEKFLTENFFRGTTLDYLVNTRLTQYREQYARQRVEEAKRNNIELSFEDALGEVDFGYEDAKEEVIANALEDMFDKPSVMKELA